MKVFSSGEPEVCPVYDDQGRLLAYVAGVGHETQQERTNLVKSFTDPGHDNVPYIGQAHVWVMGSRGEAEHDRYAPCTFEDLLAKYYAYWALGHIHNRARLCDRQLVVYPGKLVGRQFKEEGLKGAYLVEIDDTGETKAEFYPLAPVCWSSFRVGSLSAANSLADLQEHILKAVSDQMQEEQLAYDIIASVLLERPSPLYAELGNEDNTRELEEYLLVSLGFRHVEVNAGDVARPVLPDEYKGKPHVLGAALEIIEKAKTDPKILMKLKPERLAGCTAGDNEETLSYLLELLQGMEYDVTARLLEEEGI